MYSLRKASMCLVAVLAVAGCSSPGGDAGTPKAGGTLIMARTQDIDNLDPHVSTAFAGIETLGLVYDTLVDTDDQLNPAPGLAKSWDISNGASTITFHLREGVTFHNGDEFDSEDVKAQAPPGAHLLDDALYGRGDCVRRLANGHRHDCILAVH